MSKISILSITTSNENTPELKSVVAAVVDNRIIAAYFDENNFVYRIWATDDLPLEKEIADNVKKYVEQKLKEKYENI
jgi:hypothetical protein